jgi:D-xylose 1-dehydrogenase (NADP+, D-xylono-1,5-lactone-forming)
MIRWGLLSTAAINAEIIRAGAHAVAVGSRDESRARAFADAHDIPRAHGSYEALLADPGVDAVYVSLPNALHARWAIRALEAGKHVLVEKPFTGSAADAEAAFDAAERAGRVLMEGLMWRFHPQAAVLARLARESRPRVVRAVFGFDLPDRSDVRWSAELGGGALMDVGCYCLSALRLVCGEPEQVSAEAVGDGVDARIAAVLRFPGGVLGTIECGMDMPLRMGLEVVGEEATLGVVPWPQPGDITIERPGRAPEVVAARPQDPFALELEAFRAAVEDGAPLPFGRDDAVGQARAIEAVGASAAAGRARRPGAA